MSTNKDRVILVVGGACGMGAETVCRLYREGAKLVVLDLNEEAWEELVEDEELTDGPGTIDFVGGACYTIGGSLQGISNKIFIAAPGSVDLSGDFIEMVNDTLNMNTLNLSIY